MAAHVNVVGHPVEGVRDWAEEIALLFAEATQSEVRKLVRKRALEEERSGVEARIVSLSAELTTTREAERALGERIHQAQFTARSEWQNGVGIMVGSVVVAVVLAWMNLILLIPGIGGVIFALFKTMKHKAREEEKLALERELRETAARASRLEAELSGASEQSAQLASKIADNEPRQVLQAVGRLYLPLMPVEMGGHLVLCDTSGTTKPTCLRLPALSSNEEVVGRVRAALDGASQAPVLLRPTDGGPGAPGALQGEERDLREALEGLGEMLGSVEVTEAQLPLVESDSSLMQAAARGSRREEAPGAVLRTNALAIRDKVALVARHAERMRADGDGVEASLRRLRDDLRATIARYEELRDAAIEQAHVHVREVLGRSQLASVTYHCPQCHRVPQYLYARLGIDPDQAHEHPPSELLAALERDEQAAQRLSTDAGLVAEMDQLYVAMGELKHAISQLEAAPTADTGIGQAKANAARSKALRAQHAQLVTQFRAVLNKVLTGTARPLLDLSVQARLHLDPDTGDWHCPLCDLRIDDPEIAGMGRLLRIKEELLMPMWNHLWSEKDDLRKIELFRTNEQIQRLIEKEAAALRAVSEQYRADMRPVRENLIVATGEALHKREQLAAAVNSLRALGVLPEERARATLARVGAMTGGDLGESTSRFEAKETTLNHEPQAQMSRRSMALDPVQVLLGPESLFRDQARALAPLRLVGPKEQGE